MGFDTLDHDKVHIVYICINELKTISIHSEMTSTMLVNAGVPTNKHH